MLLNRLENRPGARKRKKRIGCGESSGHGKTSGRGHKGQKARSGGSLRLGFEGGQMPMVRRMPKRGFNNFNFRTEYAVVNLDDLNQFKENTTITLELLQQNGFANNTKDGLKILGRGKLTKKLNVKAHAFSASAREEIEKAGGKVEVIAGEAKQEKAAK